jgi:superfamily II DNA/RNA helicase
MIEVGLDVPRLGLMTIVGQPKSSSQYIQVSGRVGRSEGSPGLVISLLNPNVYRDRSHYENFTNWHDRLYSSVEPASVTPFTKRSLQRTLASVLTILLRVMSDNNKVRESIKSKWDEALAAISDRAKLVDESSVSNLEEVAADLRLRSDAQVNVNAKWDSSDKASQFIFDPSDVLDRDKIHTSWKVLNSMRSVDSDAGLQFSSEVFGRGLKKPKSSVEIEIGEI